MRSIRGTFTLVALAASLIVGCGSSALSTSQLRQQAGAICGRANAQIGKIPTPASEATGNTFLKKGVVVLQPALADLRALTPPSDETVVYQAALKALAGELDALKTATRRLDQGEDPVRTFRSLQDRLGPLETDADNAWRALDIPQCLSRPG